MFQAAPAAAVIAIKVLLLKPLPVQNVVHLSRLTEVKKPGLKQNGRNLKKLLP